MAKQIGKSVKRPGIGGTIAKIAFGVIVLGVSGSDPGESDPVAFLTMCLAIGLALIAWGVLPWLAWHREKKARRQETERKRAEAARLREEKKTAEENKLRVCPNCGATGRGLSCEYCGSVLP